MSAPAVPTIGTADDRPITIDVDDLVQTRLLIQCNSGGGKSWAVRRLLEQTASAVPAIVIDIEGDFHTLREKHDFVLAGRSGGDCPAHPNAAAALAKKLRQLGVSAIVDISDLERRERFAFARLFLEALIEAPREHWRPTLVVVDEAQTFCPESGSVESTNAVIDLATRGRKRGLGAVFATQRLSLFAKGAAAECNNVMVGRTILDVDQKRAADVLGLSTREDRIALRALKAGSFHVFGPAFGVRGVEIVRVGSVATSHPKVGARAAKLTAAPERVKKVLGELDAIPKEVQREADDLAAAKKRIGELTRELAGVKGVAPAPSFSNADFDRMSKTALARVSGDRAATLDMLRSNLAAIGEELEAKMLAMFATFGRALVAQIGWVGDDASPKEFAAAKAAVDAAGGTLLGGRDANGRDYGPEGPKLHGDASVTRPMQRIIDAIAWLDSSGVPMPRSRKQVAAIAGYSPRSSSYANTVSACSTAGLLTYPGDGNLALTEKGLARTTAMDPARSAKEIQARVDRVLTGPLRRLLAPLLAAYPDAMTRERLAVASGASWTSSSFSNNVSALSTLGAITYPAKGCVRAADWLFLR